MKILTNKKYNELISQTIIATAQKCGRNLSMKEKNLIITKLNIKKGK